MNYGFQLMRLLALSIIVLVPLWADGQGCGCKDNPGLNELISCKPHYLDNKAKLFWNFDCNSSNLIFESPQGRRKVICSFDKQEVELTTRLGYSYFTEFRTTFLYTSRVISGCCEPDEYFLHDKSTGNLIKNLGRALFVSENRKLPIVVSVTGSSYDDNARLDLNSLTVYNIDQRKSYIIALPKGDIQRGLINNRLNYPEKLFSQATISKNKLHLRYTTELIIPKGKSNYKTIIIDLRKYC